MHPTISTLLRWYRAHARVLPWREQNGRRPTGYQIFISEIMLQQTQVDRVLPKYEEWMRRFSGWSDVARATNGEIIRAWAGLGYNRRALQIREAAQTVVHEGEPVDEEGWRRLKGVGPYAAAALASFVNHAPSIVIDTNIRRVVGRIFLRLPFPTPTDNERIRRVLQKTLPVSGKHWEIPQAFMDLGALICTAKNANCTSCPLRTVCSSAPRFLSSHPPRPPARTKKEPRHHNKQYPDRIYRGRILAWVRTHGATATSHLGRHVDETFNAAEDQDWIERIVRRMVTDGLVVEHGGKIDLPS